MDYKCENGILTIFVSGSIDSSNAEEKGNEINQIRDSAEHEKMILDLKDLTYISSAGLRKILQLRRREKLEIINVSSEVYEIFDMTGFTDMMKISKAYREIDVTGCEKIGEGSNGIVYRISDDIIVKVYKNDDCLADIQRERELARTALVLGVNTAIPFDVVKVGNHYGSVFELLSAKSLTKLILANPDRIDEYVQVLADMLKEIHSTVVESGTLPKVKDAFLGYADDIKDYLPEGYYEKLHRMIAEVPDSDHMIHGDYHTNNVHFANGEAILIDMDTLAVGDPLFEFAGIYLGFKGFNELDANSSMAFMKLNKELCSYIYDHLLVDYFGGELSEQQDCSIRILSYARLLRRTIRHTPDETETIQTLIQKLTEMMDRTDHLSL